MFIGAVAPIQISACSIHRNRAFVDPYGAIAISFVDRGAASADEVRFKVTYHGREEVLRDRGTFSPGVTIDQSFKAFWGAHFIDSAPSSCAVEYVHFSDGSSWSSTAQDPNGSSVRRLPSIASAPYARVDVLRTVDRSNTRNCVAHAVSNT